MYVRRTISGTVTRITDPKKNKKGEDKVNVTIEDRDDFNQPIIQVVNCDPEESNSVEVGSEVTCEVDVWQDSNIYGKLHGEISFS